MFSQLCGSSRIRVALGLLALFLLSVSSYAASDAPKNIIMLIGDGMGVGHVTAARNAGPGRDAQLAMDTMPFTGFAMTYSLSGLVTDSAASGTALATGNKTLNGYVSLSPDEKPFKTILELARELGKSTGIISTVPVTDATPAVFAAHVKHRSFQPEIASQMIASGVDLVLGGGKRFFLPSSTGEGAREDDRDLLAEARDLGYDVFVTAEAMEKSTADRMIGLFSDGGMTTQRPEPTIAEMTAKAISVLNRNKAGFFFMAEGGQIDHAAHNNDAEGVVRQTIMFDDAVRIALDFAASDGETLVLVTADHDTAGMGVLDVNEENPRVHAGWVGGGHTGNMVPIYAYGPGAQLFTGTRENTYIPKTFAELWGSALGGAIEAD